jgi:hypothetical protein
MRSFTSAGFRKLYQELPEEIRRQAREAYRFFSDNPNHPGLQFKKVHSTKPIYSARVNVDYRVLGIRDRDEIVWFWIGSHAEYTKLLPRL